MRRDATTRRRPDDSSCRGPDSRILSRFGAIIVALIVAVAGCGSNASSQNGTASFLATRSNAVIFIQWTRSGAAISGSIELTGPGSPPGTEVSTQQSAFTGTIAGGGLTLQLEQTLYLATTLTGRIRGPGITLTFPGANNSLVPVTFAPDTTAAYNRAVHVLQISEYPSPCMLYVDKDPHVAVIITGPNAPSDCASFVQAGTADDATWTTEPPTAVLTTTTACNLSSATDRAIVDSNGPGFDGFQTDGQQACNTLEDQGWTVARPTNTRSTTSSTPTTTVATCPTSASSGLLEAAARTDSALGFNPQRDCLSNVKTIPSGWAIATVTARNPSNQGNESIIFRRDPHGWKVVTYGSSFTGSSVPLSIIQQLLARSP